MRQQSEGGYQHAGRADAALRGAMPEKGCLQPCTPLPKAGHRCHLAPADADRRGTLQAQTAAPSTSTVQAPQSPAEQPTLTSRTPKRSRKVSLSRSPGVATEKTACPFRLKVSACALTLFLCPLRKLQDPPADDVAGLRPPHAGIRRFRGYRQPATAARYAHPAHSPQGPRPRRERRKVPPQAPAAGRRPASRSRPTGGHPRPCRPRPE